MKNLNIKKFSVFGIAGAVSLWLHGISSCLWIKDGPILNSNRKYSSYMDKGKEKLYEVSCSGKPESSLTSGLTPYYVTGFSDAEASFTISRIKGGNGKAWPRLVFKIGVHIRDKDLLERISLFFGVGKVYADRPTSCQYIVQTISGLEAIVKHFETYPLITQKRADFELFRQAFYLVLAKEHLTKEGFQRYLNLRATINNGNHFQDLLVEYPDTVKLPKPCIEHEGIIDPYWIAGFVDGDGCFRIKTRKCATYKLGVSVNIGFILTQDIRDGVFMRSMEKYFNCGGYSIATDGLSCEYHVYRLPDIIKTIIPHGEIF
uniref:LAGLIDADG endonuclease n=1 Tax=Chrysoporthe cubensis TaxID=305400 RepID=A0A191MX25_9PEZI|nr:LAGLIDADG endonuclease [Chrysoporthe cubensis]AMX22225.1 LAGLIDADG endonuclease [Chrysoporthe cubensis]